MRKFAKELAFVRRYHKLPAELDKAALFFGGRDAVEKAIEAALARDVFERNIRTEAEYRAYETEVGRTLFDRGHALTQTVLKIVELNAKLRTELAKAGVVAGGGGEAANAPTRGGRPLSLYELSKLKDKVKPEYLDAVAADLDRLVPKDFPARYAIARLARIPRYLEGLLIRLERARIAPDKDKAKAAQVEPYAFELARLEKKLATVTGNCPRLPGPRLTEPARPFAEKSETGIMSPISKQDAVDDLRWMIEEFKLSLFAPEIKTAFPISAVRLARKIAEIEAAA
jgi:ATP-dependent helicase HrpA